MHSSITLQTIGAEKKGSALNSRVSEIKSLAEAPASGSAAQRQCALFSYEHGKLKDQRKERLHGSVDDVLRDANVTNR